MKKKKSSKTAGGGFYVLLFAIICIFAFAVAAASFIKPGAPSDGAGTGSGTDGMHTPNVTSQTSPPDSGGDVLPVPGGDAVFRVEDADTLYMLAESDAFDEYYRTSGEEPVIFLEGSITLDRTLTLHGGMKLFVAGELLFSDDDVKIRIEAEGVHTVDITCDEPVSRFEIDAPESALRYSGGNIPFIKEVAEMQNVASYNGTSVKGAADGDTLGGTGRATAYSATLFRDKRMTKEWDGSYASIEGNLITVYVPHDATDDDFGSLSILITSSDGKCDIPSEIDLTSPALIDVVDGEGRARTYRLTAKRANYGIPLLELYTDDGKDIKSKNTYKTGTMRLDGVEYALSVKGRGNTSWHTFPKKSYRLKLDEKSKLLGMSSDRDWCLIGNYVDPSLLRNIVASDMAKTMSALKFTPSYRSVDLFINGEYKGVYMLSEKIEVAKDKVDLGDPILNEDGSVADFGFFLEFGLDLSNPGTYGKDWFNTDYCKHVYIKDPDPATNSSADYKAIYNYVRAAEAAVVSGKGYEDYLDLDSWVDWFIVNELTNNTESSMFRSFFMYKPAGGKLTVGPIWDFDLAFGNHTADIPSYKGWASVDFIHGDMNDNWMMFLTKDEKFMSLVRARWAEMKETLMDAARASVEKGAAELETAQENNFKVWDAVLTSRIPLAKSTRLGFKTWKEHVDYILDFLDKRYAWMDSKLS